MRSKTGVATSAIVGFAATIFVAALALYFLPVILTSKPTLHGKDLVAAQNAARTACAAFLAALGASATAVFAWRSYDLNRQGHVTDRYGSAVAQLGSADVEVRIGGIFALERLARDSPSDQTMVVEVLAAYLRNHSVVSHDGDGLLPIDTSPRERGARAIHRAPQDVEAALAVIGRRVAAATERRIDLRGADLSRCESSRANLRSARLQGADLSQCRLAASDLSRSSLGEADLRSSVLDRALFLEARMDRSNFAGAFLIGAQLRRASIRGADLSFAFLTKADLTEADLFGAVLKGAELRGARFVDASLENADCVGASMVGCDFARTTVRQCNMAGARVNRGALSESQLAEVMNVDLIHWIEAI